jgi:PAS domain S-box-containing protein
MKLPFRGRNPEHNRRTGLRSGRGSRVLVGCRDLRLEHALTNEGKVVPKTVKKPGVGSGLPRVSLRTQGLAALMFPVAVLFIALFSVYQVDLSVDSADRTEANAIQSLSRLTGAEQRIFEQAWQVRDRARAKLLRTLIVCGILGPVGAILIHLLISGRMVRRIHMVGANAQRLAHGLPLEPYVAGNDEIAGLSQKLECASLLLSERQRELRESEARYRDLFDRAPIPYEETGREGEVRRINQAACSLLKCQPELAVGGFAWNYVAPDYKETFRAGMLERIASGDDSSPLECEYMTADGVRISVEIRENFIRNEQGEVTGVCRSLLDVTERNLAELAAHKVAQYAMELRNKNEQLAGALHAARMATEAKSRFLASISHELRTPLNGIIGFSELMYDGKVGPMDEQHREYLGDILASARHLLALISDILDLAKVESGKMEFSPEPCLLDSLVQEVRDVMRPLAEKKNLQFSTDVPTELKAEIDPGRFKQVLYNYLSNAMKFTPRDGSVTLRLRTEGDSWFRVEVEDTGIGIPAQEIPRLFEEFERVPNSRQAEQGTGLGLSLTRRIVEAQGGKVGVSSMPGVGSVFTALLPLLPIRPLETASVS